MRRVLTFLLLAFASPAAALSCMQPDVARTYKSVDAASERWGAVIGRLDFDQSRVPSGSYDADAPDETRLRAQLVGHSLGPDGWDKPFQGNVTLSVGCFHGWCGTPKSGQVYLAFIELSAGGHTVYASPCGDYLFANPTQKDRTRLQRCFAGGPCRERPPR